MGDKGKKDQEKRKRQKEKQQTAKFNKKQEKHALFEKTVGNNNPASRHPDQIHSKLKASLRRAHL